MTHRTIQAQITIQAMSKMMVIPNKVRFPTRPIFDGIRNYLYHIIKIRPLYIAAVAMPWKIHKKTVEIMPERSHMIPPYLIAGTCAVLSSMGKIL